MQKFLPFRPAFAWLRHICSVELTFTNERTVTNWCRAGACRHAAVFRREAARRRATALHSTASLRLSRIYSVDRDSHWQNEATKRWSALSSTGFDTFALTLAAWGPAAPPSTSSL